MLSPRIICNPKKSQFIANAHVRNPAKTTNIPSKVFENLRMTRAYRIFARYSHMSDQEGPFKGFVSAHPLMSREGGTGNIVKPTSITATNSHHGILEIIGKALQSP